MLFVGGMAAAVWRATGRLLWPRIVLTSATTALIVAVTGLPPLLSLAIAFVGVAVIAAVEQRAGSPIEDVLT